MYQLTNFILTVGMVVISILIILLFNKKNRNLSRVILGAIFSLLLMVIIFSYGELNDINWMKYLGFLITDTIGFLVGPLLLFYSRSIFSKLKFTFRIVFIHFLPAILYLVLISIPFYISLVKGNYVVSYLSFLDQNDYLLHIQAVYLMIYAFTAFQELKRYELKLKNHFSNLSKKDVRWIKYFLLGIIFIMVLDLGIEMYGDITEYVVPYNNQMVTLSLVIIVVYLGYFGIKQTQILVPQFTIQEPEEKAQKQNTAINHHLANATKKEIEELKKRLHIVLKKDKPYKNENLTLALLAELIPTTDRKLSALLNHYLNTSFYDLINHYRVEDVKEKMMLSEYEKYTLIAIAQDAGFNSKTSFNRIFKKETGLSPSGYKKQYASK